MALTTHRADAGVASAFRFAGVRLTRIYTGWWPIFAAYCAWLIFKGQMTPEKDLVRSFFLLLTPFESLVNVVVWTLTFELYFYFLISGVLFFEERRRDDVVRCLFLVVAAYTVYMAFNQRFEPERIYESTSAQRFWLSPLMLEFLGGFLICKHVMNHPSQSPARWLFGVVVLTSIFVLYQSYLVRHPGGMEVFYHYPDRVLFVGGAACALMGYALVFKNIDRSPVTSFLSALGDSSYAIYLLHLLALWVSVDVFGRINPAGQHKWVMYVTMLIFLVGFSWMYHNMLERPMYSRVKQGINGLFTRKNSTE